MQKLIDFVFLGLTAYVGWQLQQQQAKMIENNKQIHEFLHEERAAYISLRNDYFVLLQNYLNVIPHLEDASKLKGLQEQAQLAEEIAADAREELYKCSEKYTDLHSKAMEQMQHAYEQMQKHLQLIAAEIDLAEGAEPVPAETSHEEDCGYMAGYECTCEGS